MSHPRTTKTKLPLVLWPTWSQSVVDIVSLDCVPVRTSTWIDTISSPKPIDETSPNWRTKFSFSLSEKCCSSPRFTSSFNCNGTRRGPSSSSSSCSSLDEALSFFFVDAEWDIDLEEENRREVRSVVMFILRISTLPELFSALFSAEIQKVHGWRDVSDLPEWFLVPSVFVWLLPDRWRSDNPSFHSVGVRSLCSDLWDWSILSLHSSVVSLDLRRWCVHWIPSRREHWTLENECVPLLLTPFVRLRVARPTNVRSPH